MTREEAIEVIKQDIPCEYDADLIEALDMAIKALEQEPCNTDTCKVVKAYINGWNKTNNSDAISRQAYIERFRKWAYSEFGRKVDNETLAIRVAMSLPSVTPQPKTGHWIKSRDHYGNNHFTCPFCGNDIATKSDTWNDNYCSNCGSKMESEEV